MNKKELEMVRERSWDKDALKSITSRRDAQTAGIQTEDQTKDDVYLVAYCAIYKSIFVQGTYIISVVRYTG